MKPIRVLFVVPNLRVCNGVATYTMNYFRNMNKEKIKIDFLLLNSIPTPYYDEIRQAEVILRYYHLSRWNFKIFKGIR